MNNGRTALVAVQVLPNLLDRTYSKNMIPKVVHLLGSKSFSCRIRLDIDGGS